MSRNFELLAQIEDDLSTAQHDAQPQQESAIESELERSPRPSYPGSDEILHMVRRVFLPVKGEGLHRVLFCGATEDLSSSIVCARVARTLASQTYKKVCVIDGNLAWRRLSVLLGNGAFSGAQDTTAVADGRLQLEPNLYLLRSESLTAQGSSTLAGTELSSVFAQLEKEFDFIVIDGPSPTVSDDCILLGQLVEAAILVIEAGRTRRTVAAEAKGFLARAGVVVAGTVLHNHTLPVPEKLYRWL
ncbi:MAG: hypothetical protein ACLGSD_10715 [Acidobacteriota bacterium]